MQFYISIFICESETTLHGFVVIDDDVPKNWCAHITRGVRDSQTRASPQPILHLGFGPKRLMPYVKYAKYPEYMQLLARRPQTP